MGLLAAHLLRGRFVTGWAYAAKPHSIIWMALDNGTLLGLTVLPEHSITAWHRHNTDGHIEAVAVLPSPDGDMDLLWLLVRRNGVRQVEILSPWFDSGDKAEGFFVDGGASYYGAPTEIISGLDWLEDREVAIYADGQIHPTRTVRMGAVALDYAAQTVHVGLPYASTVRPTRPEIQLQQGSSLMQKRRVIRALLRLYQTVGITVRMVGASGGQSTIRNFLADTIDTWPSYTELEDIVVAIGGAWDGNKHLEIFVGQPIPATVLAMVSEVEL